ncbi:patatin-like protein [Moorena sp. SIO3I8]|uniref:patatin-like protein n=2 Tax=unclassified Moorena TaxID=2683338 RepID=UPI0013C0B41F|nr:patatin-like protein [Moorena sp. SIO3I8]NEO09454.1 patatin-like protein [Moorena sp. SIO3I8]
MSSQNFRKPEFSRELRLGLVVYGGVSLAIYMNGVCREFYNAVRGRGIYKLVKALTDSDIIVDILSGTSAGGINGVLLSYALTNSSQDEVIDFENFAQIWRENGNIRKLMHKPSISQSKNDGESILDGKGYYQDALAKAFEQGQINKKKAPSDEWVSSFNELDLFVTGTDVVGRVDTVFDDTGRVIDLKDHRTIFHLKHRQGRKEPFNPNFNPNNSTVEDTYQALAKLCRITSCFPVAFPVVTVELDNPSNQVDAKLVEWGILKNRKLPETPPTGGYQLHFVDGGVLDNRPFSYTIKEMYYRADYYPVERKLFYIDPSPDNFAGSQKFNQMAKPDVWEVIQESLLGMPTYESISNDLGLIKDRNQKIQRYQSLLADAESPLFAKADNSQQTTLPVETGIYWRSRLISLRDRTLPLVLRMSQVSSTKSYQETLNNQVLLDKIAKLLTQHITEPEKRKNNDIIIQDPSQQISNIDIEYALRKHFYIVKKVCQLMNQEQSLSEYKTLQSLALRLGRHIKLLEVIKIALTKLLTHPHISQSFYDMISSFQTNHSSKSTDNLRREIYNRLIRLYRFLLDAEGLAEFVPQNHQQSYLEKVPAYFLQKLPEEAAEQLAANSETQTVGKTTIDWLPQRRISSIFEQFKQKVNQVEQEPNQLQKIWLAEKYKNNINENNGNEYSSVLCKIEEASEKFIELSGVNQSEELLTRFKRFRELDKVLYPFEYLSEIEEKNLIETIRISPDDAQLGFGKGQKLDSKLAGNTLNAFGGFFKKSWRSNDIMWGRLDGLNRIVEALLTPEGIAKFPKFLKRQAQEYNIPEAGEEFDQFKEQYLDFLIQESFPNATADHQDKIKGHLRKLATPNPDLSEADIKTILDDLVLEGHRDILSTDLQNVIEDEISEQLEWSNQRVQPAAPNDSQTTNLTTSPTTKPQYSLVEGSFSETISLLAAQELARKSIDSLPQGKETFFLNHYQVGSETFSNDIPTTILTNLATRAALIVRDMLITVLGDRTPGFGSSLIYQVLNKSLQLFYWWQQITQSSGIKKGDGSRQKLISLVVQVALLLIAVLSVVIIIYRSWIWFAIAFLTGLLSWLLGNPWKAIKERLIIKN